MNRSNVYQLLKSHYVQTRKEMGAVELIIELIVTYGKTNSTEVMAGRQMFEIYLSNLGRKTA